MIGLDTNILVRLLVEDNPQQAEIAKQELKKSKVAGEKLLINNIVLCEVVWVLKKSYKLSRLEIINVVEKILRTDLFEFENKDAAWWAVQQMKQGNADFSDYLIGRLNQQTGCAETITFDKKLNKSKLFRLL